MHSWMWSLVKRKDSWYLQETPYEDFFYFFLQQDKTTYGGSFLYHLDEETPLVAAGFVVSGWQIDITRNSAFSSPGNCKWWHFVSTSIVNFWFSMFLWHGIFSSGLGWIGLQQSLFVPIQRISGNLCHTNFVFYFLACTLNKESLFIFVSTLGNV